MAKNATAHDAQVVLRLYDLRREAEMRKARRWFVEEFWPETVEDYMKVAGAAGSPENAWLRQVGSYWDMAAALVVQGALHEELFVQPGCSGEMFFIFAKIHPFLKDLREKMNSPASWSNVETVATRSKSARKRLEMMTKNITNRRKAMGKAEKKS